MDKSSQSRFTGFFKDRISKNYLGFVVLILCLSCFFAIFIWDFVYKESVNLYRKKLKHSAQEINDVFYSSLHTLQNVMADLGKKIAHKEPRDLTTILEQLKIAEHARKAVQGICSWTLLDWVNTEHFMMANTIQGIVDKPLKITNRAYLFEGPLNPWKLIVCSPTIGYTSNTWILPVGMGVEDVEGNYLGLITTGINVQSLTDAIKQPVRELGAEFIVIDQNFNVVCHSFEAGKENLNILKHDLLNKFDIKGKENETISNPVNFKSLDFYSFHKVPLYSFFIFTGIDRSLVDREASITYLPRLFEIIGFALIALLLLYVFWKKKVYPLVKLSDVASEIFMGNLQIEVPKQSSLELHKLAQGLHQLMDYIQKERDLQTQLEFKESELKKALSLLKESNQAWERFWIQLNEEFHISLDENLQLAKVLLKNLEGEIDLPLSSDYQTLFLKKIIENLADIKNLSANRLNVQEIDVVKLIEDSILIQSKFAVLKNVEVHKSLGEEQILFHVDEFRFKQIITSLLHRAIQYTPEGGIVLLHVNRETPEGESHLKVMIKDSGFGLTEEDLYRLEAKFEKTADEMTDPTALNFATIQKLVQIHQGAIQVENRWREGTTVTVAFPAGLNKG